MELDSIFEGYMENFQGKKEGILKILIQLCWEILGQQNIN